jgi:hypothetical protein
MTCFFLLGCAEDPEPYPVYIQKTDTVYVNPNPNILIQDWQSIGNGGTPFTLINSKYWETVLSPDTITGYSYSDELKFYNQYSDKGKYLIRTQIETNADLTNAINLNFYDQQGNQYWNHWIKPNHDTVIDIPLAFTSVTASIYNVEAKSKAINIRKITLEKY